MDATAPTPSCWPAAAPTIPWPTARCWSAHRSRNSPSSRRAAMPAARSAQVTYENAFFNLLNALHGRYGADAVVLAGGCAYNSVANGKVLERTPFKKLSVQSAGGDAGGALGPGHLRERLLQPAERAAWTLRRRRRRAGRRLRLQFRGQRQGAGAHTVQETLRPVGGRRCRRRARPRSPTRTPSSTC